MIDIAKTYIKYILLHRWNKVSKKAMTLLDEHWEKKPIKGLKKYLYEWIKVKNNFYT